MKLPGEELAIKVFDALAKGAGVFSRPWQIEREARALAKADNLKLLGQEAARRQIEQIRSGEFQLNEDLRLIPTSTTENGDEISEIADSYVSPLREISFSPARLIEAERHINLEQIAAIAIEESINEGEDPESDESIEKDWFSQWRNRAQSVSDRDMQSLWARILKGEAKKPGQFSIHAMDFLSRMSKRDVEKLELLGQFVSNGSMVIRINDKISNSLLSSDLSFADLINFESLGILSGVSSGIGGVSFNPNQSLFNQKKCYSLRFGQRALLFVLKNQANKIEGFNIIPISFIGQELLKLANIPPTLSYLKEIAASKREQYDVFIGDIKKENPENKFELENITPI